MTENVDVTNSNENTGGKNNGLNNPDKEYDQSTLLTEDQIELEANAKTIRLAKTEYALFAHLGGMFTLISFLYSIGRILKDAAVLSKQHSSSIFGLKIGILILSIFVMGFIQKGLTKSPLTKIFNIILLIFATLFTLLGFVLFWPEKFQPDFFWGRDMFADSKYKARGLDSFCPIILIINEAMSSLLYISCEMFGSLVLSYMFMTFANGILTPLQSARFVPLLYILSNVALVSSGLLSTVYNNYKIKSGLRYHIGERINNIFFIVMGVLVLFIYYLKNRLENVVLSKPIFIKKSTKKKGPKVKVGFIEGISEMCKSKLLMCISLSVLFYAASTNLIESSYKSGLTLGSEAAAKNKLLESKTSTGDSKSKEGYDKSSYATRFNAYEQIFVGVSVIAILLSPFPKLIQSKGWIWVAIWSPIFTLFSAVIVFGLAYYNFPDNKEGEKNLFFPNFGASEDNSLIFWENFFGAFSVGLMKIHKYAAFDITKEAISMQIDSSLRARYKGIFDGVFGKLGKSLGSFYGSIMLALFNCRDIRKVSPVGGLFVIINCFIWFFIVIYLNRKYTESVKNNAPIDVDLFGKDKKVEQTQPEEPAKTVSAEI